MISENKIEELKEKIVKAISPEKIILFGSYARGEATGESDIDLVVIWDSDLNPHKRNLFLSKLFPKRNFSLDIFAFTKAEAGMDKYYLAIAFEQVRTLPDNPENLKLKLLKSLDMKDLKRLFVEKAVKLLAEAKKEKG